MEIQQQEENKKINQSISDLETTAPGKLRVIKRNGNINLIFKIIINLVFLFVE